MYLVVHRRRCRGLQCRRKCLSKCNEGVQRHKTERVSENVEILYALTFIPVDWIDGFFANRQSFERSATTVHRVSSCMMEWPHAASVSGMVTTEPFGCLGQHRALSDFLWTHIFSKRPLLFTGQDRDHSLFGAENLFHQSPSASDPESPLHKHVISHLWPSLHTWP